MSGHKLETTNQVSFKSDVVEQSDVTIARAVMALRKTCKKFGEF